MAKVRSLVSDNPAQLQRLSALDAQARDWRVRIAEREIALMRDDATRAQGSEAA